MLGQYRSLMVPLALLGIAPLLYVYYHARPSRERLATPPPPPAEPDAVVAAGQCAPAPLAGVDIDTAEQFRKFDFQPHWIKKGIYWDIDFESRYLRVRKKWKEMPLKVVIVPHFDYDRDWLEEFESSNDKRARDVLDGMADSLPVLDNLTFTWNEISSFANWWESADTLRKQEVRRLLEGGRLEVATGGWVVADEATTHVYAMLDQLIEGHQWLKRHVGVSPRWGWSVEPNGHGSTLPYLLKASGLEGTVIQRVHYAWKQWLAERLSGDFLWRQQWDRDGHTDLLVHSQPFLIDKCGTSLQVCSASRFAPLVDEWSLRRHAQLLLERLGRAASLSPLNVALVPMAGGLGSLRWWYAAYTQLIAHINAHYHAHVSFGTVSDYFAAVRRRAASAAHRLPTLRGDFFPHGEPGAEGRVDYWTGYFSTRPHWKALDRELEAALRAAEILYTVALATARRASTGPASRTYLWRLSVEGDFGRLARARRALGLFQRHDAITGASTAVAMADHALRLLDAIQDATQVTSAAALSLLSEQDGPGGGYLLLRPHAQRRANDQLPSKVPLELPCRLVLFNSLAQPRQEVVRVRVATSEVRVLDAEGQVVPHQLNPVWKVVELDEVLGPSYLQMSGSELELLFLAALAPLSLTVFAVERAPPALAARATVHCTRCRPPIGVVPPPFVIRGLQPGDQQLENRHLRLLLDGRTGLLKAVTRKATSQSTPCALQFGAYTSARNRSGPSVFMPDPDSKDRQVVDEAMLLVMSSGSVASELRTLSRPPSLIDLTTALYHADGPLAEGVSLETTVDLSAPEGYQNTELYMRLVTDISNGDPPEFYSDLNGFTMQRRVKVERVGIEGNYFPATTAALLQDSRRRLTVLLSHAQGVAAWQPGWLELMLDRRTLYNDSRGVGEGVVDNKRTLSRHWLLLEDLQPAGGEVVRLSLAASHLSNALLCPTTLLVAEGRLRPQRRRLLLTRALPCDVHLVTLRTAPDPGNAANPSASALLVLHRQGYDCAVNGSRVPRCGRLASSERPRLFRRGTSFSEQTPARRVAPVSLTGLRETPSPAGPVVVEDLGWGPSAPLLAPGEMATLNVTFHSA